MKQVILAGVFSRLSEAGPVLAETEALCRAAEMEVVCTVLQQLNRPDAAAVFGRGKLQELTAAVKETEAEMVVFAHPVSLSAAEHVAEACGVEVIDRTALILQIFSRRARSRQAKLQVEAARLANALPGVIRQSDEAETHARGGSFSNRGAGEMRSSLIRRRYQNRIRQLKDELKKIESRQSSLENRRTRTRLKRVALAGYTNAGKSSLMNAFLALGSHGREVTAEDRLFETLDTSVRRIMTGSGEFLLYDTVGFVSNLPHELIDAFHTTLASVREADLVLHVIDGSDPQWQYRAEVTEETLKAIGAGEVPVLRVFTKADAGIDPNITGLSVSAFTGAGMAELTEEILRRLYPDETTVTCLVPYDKMALVETYRKIARIRLLENTEAGQRLQLQGSRVLLKPFEQYMEREEYENSMGKG